VKRIALVLIAVAWVVLCIVFAANQRATDAHGGFTSHVARSGHWPKVRADHLEREPRCAACGISDHLEVHHVLPFHDDPARELDPDNLITLCKRPGCPGHFLFGHLGDYKHSNPHVRDDAKRYRQRLREQGLEKK
jgi:hypothetical protein